MILVIGFEENLPGDTRTVPSTLPQRDGDGLPKAVPLKLCLTFGPVVSKV